MDRLLDTAYKYGCNIVYDFEHVIEFHENDFNCFCNKESIHISKLLVGDNDEALLFIVLHEILHIVGKTYERMDKYYFPAGFSYIATNIQEDMLINDYLKKNLPDGWNYINKHFKQEYSKINEEFKEKEKNNTIMFVDNTTFKDLIKKQPELSKYTIYNYWLHDFKDYILYEKICEVGLEAIDITFQYIQSLLDKFEKPNFIKVFIEDYNKEVKPLFKPKKYKFKSITEFKKLNTNDLIYKKPIVNVNDNMIPFLENDVFLLYKVVEKLQQLSREQDRNLKALKILYVVLLNEEISNAAQQFSKILDDIQSSQQQQNNNPNGLDCDTATEIENQYKQHEKIYDIIESDVLIDLNNLSAGKQSSFFKKTKKKFKYDKIKTKKMNEFERIIFSYIDKFFIKKGISRTYKRQHRIIDNLKGRQHKKRGFKNIQIFLDYSSSMYGSPINKLRNCYYSINKVLLRHRMIGFYRVFNTDLSEAYTYKNFIKQGYEPNGGTNINNVLKNLEHTNYNIVVTDAEDLIDFNLIDKDMKLLWFVIGDDNYRSIKNNETDNIKIIKLE